MQNKHSYLTGYVTNLPKGNAEWYVYVWGWGGGGGVPSLATSSVLDGNHR